MPTALDKMINSVKNAQDVLREIKAKTGRRMIGYFHPVVPEELIYAAGFQPVRLFPNFEDSITVGNSYLQTYICSYLRADFDQALKGIRSYLDGVIMPRSCEAVTFSYQTWKRHNPYAFIDYLNVPWKRSDNTIVFFTKELERVKQNLEAFGGQEISENELRNAIQLYNRNRELLHQVYDMRRAAAPPISGFEAIHVVMSGFLFDKMDHNRLLEQLLSELPQEGAQASAKPRLLISGGRVIDRRIWEVIESAGAHVVADDVNNGSRSFRHSLPETAADPLEALASSYATVPCAFNTSIQDRFDFISDMIISHKVDGVVFAINRNCETEAFAYPELEKRIKERFGIPTIHIETDYMMRLEPFRDRVEAFLQLLGT